MTTHSDTDTQAAAELAAAEHELTALAEDAAAAVVAAVTEPATEAATAAAPDADATTQPYNRRGLRMQAVELVGQVKQLSKQVEAQRLELEAFRAARAPIASADEVVPLAAPAAVATIEPVATTPVAVRPVAPVGTQDAAHVVAASPAVPEKDAAPLTAGIALVGDDGPELITLPESAAKVLAPAVVAAVPPLAVETAVLTFDTLIDNMPESERDLVEKHIVGLRTALEKEREDRKIAQRAVRTAQSEIETIPPLRQQLELAQQDELDTRAQALFFEHAGTNNVKRGSARLAFLAAKDGQFFDDDGSVQWESLQSRFPDLFEGTDRSAPTGVIVGAPVQRDVVPERPVATAPRATASAGAGGGAPPRRPFSMTSAIRSAAGRAVK